MAVGAMMTPAPRWSLPWGSRRPEDDGVGDFPWVGLAPLWIWQGESVRELDLVVES